jgi:hypothetical protein
MSVLLGETSTGGSKSWRGRNGRANASESKQMTPQRSSNRRICSSRLRRVMRGGEGKRNINELKRTFSFEVRRMR